MDTSNQFAKDMFPAYTVLPKKIPVWFWRLIQIAGVVTVLVLVYILFFFPETGLFILWKIAVPVLPLVFVFMPGIWRNSCPLAIINQTPLVFGFARDIRPPRIIKNYGYVIAISLLLILVTSRKIIFNTNGELMAILILIVAVIAFFGGFFFSGKSGFCSTICPVLPVERIYGQSPFIYSPNVHCSHCVGCTRNCYDYNPSAAYLADQYSEDKLHSAMRRIFASLFPGFVLSYFIIDENLNSVPEMLIKMFLITSASSVVFYILNAVLKTSANKLPSLFGITAFTIYYWFTIPILAGSFTKVTAIPVPAEIIFALRFITIAFSIYWLNRAYSLEKKFVSNVLDSGIPVKILFGYNDNGSYELPKQTEVVSDQATR